MTTVPDPNVHMLAIEGSFDDCQAILKSTFGDLPFKERYRLGARQRTYRDLREHLVEVSETHRTIHEQTQRLIRHYLAGEPENGEDGDDP